MPLSGEHGLEMFRFDVRRLRALRFAIALLLFAPCALRAATLEVVVEGLEGSVQANALSALTIYQERNRPDLTETRIRRLHATAPEEIRAAVKPYGYYQPTIDASLDFDRAEDHWTARYRVQPGPVVRIAAIEINLRGEGATDPVFRNAVEHFPLRRGDPLNQVLYEQGKSRIQSLASERGYFDMRLTRHEIRLDLDAFRAEIYIDVDTGARYRFGEIQVDQDLLTPQLLERYVRIEPGTPYSTRALLDAQNALTAYFSEVKIDADPKQAKDRVIPVTIKLKRRPQNKYTFGIGYGTDTGPRGQIGWERYYLNPEGHHARIDLRGSEIDRSLTAGYFIPIRNPRTDQLGFTGGFEETDTDTVTSSTRRLAVSRSTVRGYLLETLSLTHQLDRFTVGGQTGKTTLVLPGVSWTYYIGDDRIYTRSGARMTLDVRGATETFGSDVSMRQARFQMRAIFPVASAGRLITRFDVARTSVDNFPQLPASLRFFAGGDQSVRGYAYNSLGPTDAQGTVVGGPHLLVGSVEYEHQLTGKWSAAIFFDEGNALNNFRDPLKKGAGIGMRWRTPIGQIRVDVAEALSETGHPKRFHITIGPDL
jgi:translocation and assembly module TamA